MYTYKRFRTSKSVVTIILIVLALVAWGILASTSTPLAGEGQGPRTVFSVTLELTGTDSEGNPYPTDKKGNPQFVLYTDGWALWPGLSPQFWGDDDIIQVGGVDLDLTALVLGRQQGSIVWARLFLLGDGEVGYCTSQIDLEQPTPSLPKVGDSFTVYIGKSVDVSREKGREKGTVLGTLFVGNAVYTRTK